MAVGGSTLEPLVIVVGLGGVGSHCAHALIRAGVRRLRLVDFDRVSLSSLNRHAVATRQDVGISKVVTCAGHFRAISPSCEVDAWDEIFNAASASRLLLGEGQHPCPAPETPAVVIDCIDDVPTKADLLEFCSTRDLHVISALGSGAKGDPARLCVARGLRDIENDALATKLRQVLRSRSGDCTGIPFVYSSQKAVRSLLPLTEEQRRAPGEFGNVAHFRLRVIPVLGTQPALAGVAVASTAMLELQAKHGKPLYGLHFTPRPAPPPRRAVAEKYLEQLRKREAALEGGQVSNIVLNVTVGEILFLVHEVWKGRSALNCELAVSGASGQRFTIARWDRSKMTDAGNIILCTEEEAGSHQGPEHVPQEVRKRVDEALTSAKAQLCLPPPSAAGSDAEIHFADYSQSAVSDENLSCTYSRNVNGCVARAWSEKEEQEEAQLLEEQLSRSAAFFGHDGHQKLLGSFVVIVGVGNIGSAAAVLLARAGIKKIRLIDGADVVAGACHAVSCWRDHGIPKVTACRKVILAIRPHGCDIEAAPENFTVATAEQVLGPGDDGRWPDVVVDCTGRMDTKADLIACAAKNRLHVVSAVASRGAVDPTRISVAALPEVHSCPAAVSLRLAAAKKTQADSLDFVTAVFSQEYGHWARQIPSASRGSPFEALVQLSLGLAAAAAALYRIAGEALPAPDPAGAIGAWRKLGKNVHSASSVPGSELDPYTAGCIVEHIWAGRTAYGQCIASAGRSLRLVQWDCSKPCELTNLVPMTEEDAVTHIAEIQGTGSLPQPLLRALAANGGEFPQPGSELYENLHGQLRVHQVLVRLHQHLAEFQEGVSCTSDGPVARNPASAEKDNTQEHPSTTIARAPSIGAGFAGLVGNTPLVELPSLSEAVGCRIVAKAEFLSPGGCQKDRVAKQILDEAEKAGLLQPGAAIVEGTSGSTGIALALAAVPRGYRTVVVMPDDQAHEKVELLRRFGAEVELVRPASINSPEHYVNVARRRAAELAAEPGSPGAIFADQFENPANFRAHYSCTGPELWSQCVGQLDAFVMSAGTGGTIAGVGRFLKSVAPNACVYLADVPGSSLYCKVVHGVLYAHEQAERIVRRHRTDTIAEGIGLDRLTANFARGLPEHNGGTACIDGAVRVSDQEALEMAHYILRHEGLFIGSSAAVNCVGACKVARRLPPGGTVATILCDSGHRHLTKFYNSEVWPEFGLEAPVPRQRGDLSFVDT